MKICDKCGAFNSDERFFCVDCNEKLDDALSQSEQGRIEASIDSKIDGLYNETDPLYVSRFDKIFGFIALIGAVATVVLYVVDLFISHKTEGLWMSLILFLFGTVEAFFPKVTWEIEKLRLSFYIGNAEDSEPSGFYKLSRKLSILIFIGVAGFILVANALLVFKG